MIDHTPKVDGSLGAPMGRGYRSEKSWEMHGKPMFDKDAIRAPAPTGRVSLVRLRLNSGGYDRGGAYWGLGEPIFSAVSECGAVDITCRAKNREAAKAVVLSLHPGAKFYR